MLLLILSFIAGGLTVFSPCVLPFLPVILGGSLDPSARDKRRPYVIIGSLVVSLILFTVLLKITSLLIDVDPRVWNIGAGALVIGLGVFMLFPDAWAYIVSRLGIEPASQRLLGSAYQHKNKMISALLTGAALGPVFSSCSPTYAWVIATVLPANVIEGTLYLSVYCIGLATALLGIALAGRRILGRITWASNPRGWFQRAIALVFILVGIFVATGWSTSVQTWFVDKDILGLSKLEQQLIPNSDKHNGQGVGTMNDSELFNVSPYKAPELTGTQQWFNSQPLKLADLKGKVVLVDFWTYSCINCIRTLPYLEAWYEAYKNDGFVIIGVHAPEFAFEKKAENVAKAVKDYKLTYPIVQDNNLTTWAAFSNQYWPAHYLIDKDGFVRSEHFGEGGYDETEKAIRALLAETSDKTLGDMTVKGTINVPVSQNQTPETYLGYERGSNFANADQFKADKASTYTLAADLDTNEWSLGGTWNIGAMSTVAEGDSNTLRIKFSAKEVYLVMDGPEGASLTLTVNGKAVTKSYNGGSDVGDAGRVKLNGARLYTLVDMPTFTSNATLDITIPKGVSINAFTFGS